MDIFVLPVVFPALLQKGIFLKYSMAAEDS